MDLAVLSDQELQRLASLGDRQAEETLVERYMQNVRACARPFFLAGGDSEDLIQEGMMQPKFPQYASGTHCMADRKAHATIGPGGDLSPCEHYAYGSEMYGTISEGTTKSAVRARWAERVKHGNLACEACPLYAMCEKIVLCPAEGKCGSGYADYKISQIRRALRDAADQAEKQSKSKVAKRADTGSGVVPCGVC